ncbi:DUF4190 domain-containing protein [Streptomyces sp. NPDC058001]|uniref:DUF4190 domain-containing protein n=1 Tax=Streptomyces sp. NPDC058001 TaxID=3346300 RepID=UPI0036DFEA2B
MTEGDAAMSEERREAPEGAQGSGASPDPWAPTGVRNGDAAPPVSLGKEQPADSTAPKAPAGPTSAQPTATPTPPPTQADRPDPWAAPMDAPPSANPYAPPSGTASPHSHPTVVGGIPGGQVPAPPLSPEGPGQAAPYGYPGPAPYPTAYPYPGRPVPSAPADYFPGVPGGVSGYGWPGMPVAPSNGLGTASLVVGIISVVGFCMWPVAIILGILAVVFGCVSRAKARRGEATNPGQALAGIICGSVGLALALMLLVATVIAGVNSYEDQTLGAGPSRGSAGPCGA